MLVHGGFRRALKQVCSWRDKSGVRGLRFKRGKSVGGDGLERTAGEGITQIGIPLEAVLKRRVKHSE